MEIGNRIVHENFSKSNEANLGNVARIQIIMKIIIKDFKNNQNACSK